MARRSYATLKEFLAETGTTQKDFARRLGVKQGQVSRWANGSVPKPKRALQIASIANIPVTSLLLGDHA